ncbi:uncharacterized protein METZ01_LOCUS134416, partial [marine metagenome]
MQLYSCIVTKTWQFLMAGAVGIEPTNHGIKTRCL